MSNLSCTNDAEAVLAPNSQILQVYIEITNEELYQTGRKIVKHFLAPDKDEYGDYDILENSVSYDPKMYWLKGKPNKDGFFILTHLKSGKTLSGFDYIEGNFQLLTTPWVCNCHFLLKLLISDAPYKLMQVESIFSSALTGNNFFASKISYFSMLNYSRVHIS